VDSVQIDMLGEYVKKSFCNLVAKKRPLGSVMSQWQWNLVDCKTGPYLIRSEMISKIVANLYVCVSIVSLCLIVFQIHFK
jgi:hypothetical protein